MCKWMKLNLAQKRRTTAKSSNYTFVWAWWTCYIEHHDIAAAAVQHDFIWFSLHYFFFPTSILTYPQANYILKLSTTSSIWWVFAGFNALGGWLLNLVLKSPDLFAKHRRNNLDSGYKDEANVLHTQIIHAYDKWLNVCLFWVK